MVSFSWSTLLLFCSNQIYVTLTVSDLKSVFDQAWEIQHHQCDQAWEIQHHQSDQAWEIQHNQWDQIRLVLKFLGSKFSYKCGPNICQTPVFLKNVTFLNKKLMLQRFGLLLQFSWATFYSIWSYLMPFTVLRDTFYPWYLLYKRGVRWQATQLPYDCD